MKFYNAYQFKAAYLQKFPSSHFFDRKTMKFFGDTLRNFGIHNGDAVITLYRKRTVKHGLGGAFFFDAITLQQLSGIESTVQGWRIKGVHYIADSVSEAYLMSKGDNNDE